MSEIEMKKTAKVLAVILMLPFIFVGIVWGYVHASFLVGMDFAVKIANWIDE